MSPLTKRQRRRAREKGKKKEVLVVDRRPTWEALRARVQELALDDGEYAGRPFPIEGFRLSVSTGHRRHEEWDGGWLGPGELDLPIERLCRGGSVDETLVVRNRWWSKRRRDWIHLVEYGPPEDRKIDLAYGVYDRFARAIEPERRWNMFMDTILIAGDAWDLEPEAKAIEKLADHISKHQFKTYLLAGAFVEASVRSQAKYVFRKGRPTVVLLPAPGGNFGPSCALCMHPVAYYEGTFAGGMVPTDDVLAHLLLMRSDEAGLWRRSNQHPIDRIESGI